MLQQDHYTEILRLVHRIGRLMNPQHLPTLEARKLSLSHFLVLDALDTAAQPLRMSELSTLSGLSAAELSRVVGSLEEKRWLVRDADEEDSRARRVRLSKLGAKQIHLIAKAATAELAAVWQDFTHDEWHQFIDYLARFERGVRRVRTVPKTGRGTTNHRRSKKQ